MSHYEHWKKTGKLKVFDTEKEFEKYGQDLCSLPSLDAFVNTPFLKSNVKRGILDGERFDSQWEAAFYVWAKEVKGWTVQRNRSEFLLYIDNNKQKKFFPDFICNGRYYEIKGVWRETDVKKQEQCPFVEFLSSSEIAEIMDALAKEVPNWKDRYMLT